MGRSGLKRVEIDGSGLQMNGSGREWMGMDRSGWRGWGCVGVGGSGREYSLV